LLERHADWRGGQKNSNPVREYMTTRPKYLNLLQIRMPVPALVSIMHRVSGAALFLMLPVLLCWWQASLVSADTFASLKAIASQWCVKIVMLALLWGYLHHLCAGIRHLVMDVDMGTELATARLTSQLVLSVSIALTVAIGLCLW
jgi:succinate dehydrogenase / fumarate reductase cytochrome b subunit